MARSLNILHVTPFFPPDRGGIANAVSNLVGELLQHGNKVEVIAPKNLFSTESRTEPRVPSYAVTRLSSVFLLGWPYPTLRSVSIPWDLWFTVSKLIKSGNFDIIHTHGHHYPITWFALKLAHRLHIPTVLTLHGMYALNPTVLGGKSILEDWFNRLWFSRVLFWTNVVIGGTKEITRHAKCFGPANTKYCTIPTGGVNKRTYTGNAKNKDKYKSKYNLNKDSTVVLFVGRMEAVKGIIEFTQAMNNIVNNNEKKVEIVIVGDGSLRKKVELMLTNSQGVHLIDWQDPELIHEIYLASDIFVMPSRFEGFPLTIIEAMNAGLHVVYTPVGGMPEILSQYSPKTLLNEVSAMEIYKVVNDVIIQTRLSRKIPSLEYAQKFSWSNICREINELYIESTTCLSEHSTLTANLTH